MKIAKSAQPSKLLKMRHHPNDIRSSLNLTRMILEVLTESPVNQIQKAHLENALQNLSDVATIIDQEYGVLEKES